jgi:hypothetical protein
MTLDRTIQLLSRAPGLDLLVQSEHEHKEYGTVRLDADGDVRSVMQDGYTIDRIQTTADGVGVAHVSKVIGLNYPTNHASQ